MATMMTKSQLAGHLANKFELTKKQSVMILEELAKLAAKQARNGFVFPGLGKLVVVKRKARMGRNPQTGKAITIPAGSVLKFRISKAMKESVLKNLPLRPVTSPRQRPTYSKESLLKTPPPRSAPSPRQRPAYAVVPVWFATDRQASGDGRPSRMFGAGRGTLTFGVCEVSIPRDHRMGKLERPSILRLEGRWDPERHVHVLSCELFDGQTLCDRIRAFLETASSKAALVFLHGYNVSFVDAIRRTAQIKYDLGFAGAAFAYCWPSCARIAKYTTDETNIEWTQPHLLEAMRLVRDRCGAEVVHFIAHSMGNRALTRLLSSATKEWKKRSGAGRLSQVVLTAPDIDADVFRQLAAAMEGCADRITLYASSRDRAIAASKKFHTYARAGEAGSAIVVVRGVDTIDATGLDTNFMGHAYYADNRSVVSDIFHLIRNGLAPDDRFGFERQEKGGLTYWVFRRG